MIANPILENTSREIPASRQGGAAETGGELWFLDQGERLLLHFRGRAEHVS